MIYKLRKGIDPNHLNLRWLIDNPHPGTTQLVEERFEDIEMEDMYRILQYPNFIHLISSRLRILNSHYLSKNPQAIYLLMQEPELIHWDMFSTNPHPLAMEIIEQNIVYGRFVKNKMVIQCPQIYSNVPSYWRLLATNSNPKALEIIEKYYTKLHCPDLDHAEHIDFWRHLNKNLNAIPLLEKYPQNIYWDVIIENQNPNAIYLIEKNLNKIGDWNRFAGNPNAVSIIEQHLHKINDWYYLAGNPKAISILEKNLDKLDALDWKHFTENPSAISILVQIMKQQNEVKKRRENNEPVNPEDYPYYDYFNKVEYISLSINPAIFELDYQGLKERCDLYRKELVEKAMHPNRMIALLDQEGIDLEDLEDYI